MKPQWKDAPQWARWLAQDRDGEWYWYKDKPEPMITQFDVSNPTPTYAGDGFENPDRKSTIEARPDKKPASMFPGPPSWSDAPRWARWRAQSEDCKWWWFAAKPMLGTSRFIHPTFTRVAEAWSTLQTAPPKPWQDSLEENPNEPNPPAADRTQEDQSTKPAHEITNPENTALKPEAEPVIWLDRTIMRGPNLALCLSQKEFDAVLESLGADQKKWMSRGQAAVTWEFAENGEQPGRNICVVCMAPPVDEPEAISTLVHESVHVVQNHFVEIGEDHPTREQQAYAVENVFRTLFDEYARRTKGGREKVDDEES